MRKKRRHSGWKTPNLTIPKKELIKYNLFLDLYYDDWSNYRDGFRDWFNDYKKIKNIPELTQYSIYEKRIRMNKKQKKLVKRRKAKKMGRSSSI